jgi:beta-ureidopropionase / N-carbamoyl-L-amino-acid hydrolase
LHIEQGPILEAEEKEVGIVTGVQGMRWYEVTVTGESAHTGATPMRLRKNALLGAARLVERINQIAERHKPDALGAVGLMEVRPNSRNVVPGEVFFCVDLRHPEAAVLDQLEAAYDASLKEICDPLGLAVSSTRIWDQPPVRFDTGCVASVRRAVELSAYAAREIVSGAGHDAAYISRVAPTAMIFVPCRGGVSHNEAEFSSKEQCAAGAQVLLQAVLDYDRTLAERHQSKG